MWIPSLKTGGYILQLGLFVIGAALGWYMTYQYYTKKIANTELAIARANEKITTQTLATVESVSLTYENSNTSSRANYLDLIKRVREHYCLPSESSATSERGQAPTGNKLSCQDAEDIVTLMWVAEEQANQLLACQSICK